MPLLPRLGIRDRPSSLVPLLKLLLCSRPLRRPSFLLPRLRRRVNLRRSRPSISRTYWLVTLLKASVRSRLGREQVARLLPSLLRALFIRSYLQELLRHRVPLGSSLKPLTVARTAESTLRVSRSEQLSRPSAPTRALLLLLLALRR